MDFCNHPFNCWRLNLSFFVEPVLGIKPEIEPRTLCILNRAVSISSTLSPKPLFENFFLNDIHLFISIHIPIPSLPSPRVCVCGGGVPTRAFGQFAWVSCLLPPCGSWKWSSVIRLGGRHLYHWAISPAPLLILKEGFQCCFWREVWPLPGRGLWIQLFLLSKPLYHVSVWSHLAHYLGRSICLAQ